MLHILSIIFLGIITLGFSSSDRELQQADSARLEAMDYRLADSLYSYTLAHSSDHLLLLRANTGMMQICQILSHNKDYYYYKSAAHRHLAHIEVPEVLTPQSSPTDSAAYAANRNLILVEAIYLHNMREVIESRQLLNSIGLAALSSESLLSVYIGSRTLYMQSLRAVMAADQLTNQGNFTQALDSLDYALSLINRFDRRYNPNHSADQLSPCCDDSLDSAPIELTWIADSTRITIPEWMAAVRDQLSITYGAMGDKAASDYNRNIYLDILDATRVDRQPEQQLDYLQTQTSRLETWFYLLLACIIVLPLLLVIGYFLIRHSSHYQSQFEENEDEKRLAHIAVEKETRGYVERVTALSIVQGIAPFLDRAIHEIGRRGNTEYLVELIDHISHLNTLFGYWIKIRRGNIAISVSTFPLQPIFQILGKSVPLFRKSEIELVIQETTLQVKADKDLTLFMINTLLDNARKFTPAGGRITISATPSSDSKYVEISVQDTGCGFHFSDNQENATKKGSGFGLMNCRDIIEQYRKYNRLFSVCMFDVESEQDRGSRFFFRLPLVVRTLALILCFMLPGQTLNARTTDLSQVLDSIVECNLTQQYRRAVEWGDSAIGMFNQRIASQTREDHTYRIALMGESDRIADTELLKSGVDLPYDTLLMVRNEISIAALSLNRRHLYRYNNNAMTKLYRLMSADSNIELRCEQQAEINKSLHLRVQMLAVLLVLFLTGVVVVLVKQYRKLTARLEAQQDDVRRVQMEASRIHVQNLLLDNSLSTIKHETLYYPSRIRQLLNAGDNSTRDEIAQLLNYYNGLFTTFSHRTNHISTPVPFRQQPIVLADLLSEVFPNSEIKVSDQFRISGDPLLLRLMLHELTRGIAHQTLSFTVTRTSTHTSVSMTSTAWSWTESEQCNLFQPDTLVHDPTSDTLHGSSFLFARQILRIHDEHSRLHGCGIQAENGNTIAWKLENHKGY